MELDLFNNNNGKQSSSFAPQVQSELFTVVGEDLKTFWKAGVKLGELKDNAIFLLFKENQLDDKNSAIIGGEIFAEINNGEYLDHHNISLSSTGSRSFVGASDSDEKFSVVKCWYNSSPYYGIKFQVRKAEKKSINTQIFKTRNQDAPGWAGTGFNGIDSRVRYTNANKNVLMFSLGNGGANSGTPDIHSSQVYNQLSYQSPHGNWAWITFKQLFSFVTSNGGDRYGVSLSNSAKFTANSGFSTQISENWYFLCDVSPTGIRGAYSTKSLSFKKLADGTYDIENKFDLYNDPYFTFVKNHESVPSETNFGSANASGDQWSKLFEYEEAIDEGYTFGETIDIPVTDVKIYFNGWIRIPDELKPPKTYDDENFPRVVPLAEEASQSTADNTISDVVSGGTEGVEGVPEGVGGETGDLGNITDSSVADEVLDNIIETFPAVGVDKDPNILRFRETDTLTRVVLEALARSLRGDPATQLIVDLQKAKVDPSYNIWSNDLFHDCHRLRGIILPKGLKAISGPIFRGCYFLRYIDFTTSDIIGLEGGNKWNAGQYSFFEGTRVFNVIFPETITHLNKKIFENSSVRNVYIKNKGQIDGYNVTATGTGTDGVDHSFDYGNWTSWLKIYLPKTGTVNKYGDITQTLKSQGHIEEYDPDNFDFSSIDTSFYS